jgi:hypothetical protein
MAKPRNVLILAALGRNFHNVNAFFRNHSAYRAAAQP